MASEERGTHPDLAGERGEGGERGREGEGGERGREGLWWE